MYRYQFPRLMTEADCGYYPAVNIRNYLRIAAKKLVTAEREATGKQLFVKDVCLARVLYEASYLITEAYVGKDAPLTLPLKSTEAEQLDLFAPTT